MKKTDKLMVYLHQRFVQILLAVAVIFRLILLFGPWHPDLGNHLDWGIKFWEVGPKYFYENLFWRVSWANQPPGTMYLFAAIRKIYEVFFSLFWWLNLKITIFPSGIIPFIESKLYIALVKMPAILADFGIAYLVYKFVSELKNKKIGKVAALIFLFNPVTWYNSSLWGQTDSIINFFVFLSVFLLWKKHFFIAVLSFFLSLYFKGSLLIFLPFFLIYFLQSELVWWKKIMYLAVQPIIFSYLSWPFVRWMGPIPWTYHLYRDRIFGHQGNMLTANAFNLWAIIFGIDFSRDDLGVFLHLTYKQWGMLISGLTILPSIIRLILRRVDLRVFFASLVITSFASFLFLTNMHERYLYPVFPYLTVLIFLFPKLKWFYILLSLVFMLNLYNLWYVPGIKLIQAIYTPYSLKAFSIINIGIFIFFFYFFFRNLHSKKV